MPELASQSHRVESWNHKQDISWNSSQAFPIWWFTGHSQSPSPLLPLTWVTQSVRALWCLSFASLEFFWTSHVQKDFSLRVSGEWLGWRAIFSLGNYLCIPMGWQVLESCIKGTGKDVPLNLRRGMHWPWLSSAIPAPTPVLFLYISKENSHALCPRRTSGEPKSTLSERPWLCQSIWHLLQAKFLC
jgi:hypothetical protein